MVQRYKGVKAVWVLDVIMILSFHPIIEADTNIICAGRQPDASDLDAIKRAQAVILPQGCSEALYRMARLNCPHIFPNLDVRFDYPGKLGQIKLFDQLKLDYPASKSYESVTAYDQARPSISFPCVVKFNWGGQGKTVYKVNNSGEMQAILLRAIKFESTGQYGFIIQEFIPTGRQSLRVVAIGSFFVSYWRLMPLDAPFGVGVSDGASIDHEVDPQKQKAARKVARLFCKKTGLQLGGFDFIFNETEGDEKLTGPLILEINYYFGRRGLGGSEKYYDLLIDEADKWLRSLGLQRHR